MVGLQRELGHKCSFCSAERPTSEHRIAIPGPHHDLSYKLGRYKEASRVYHRRLPLIGGKSIRVCAVCYRLVQIRVIVGLRSDLSEEVRSLRAVAKRYAVLRDHSAMLSVLDEIIRRMEGEA